MQPQDLIVLLQEKELDNEAIAELLKGCLALVEKPQDDGGQKEPIDEKEEADRIFGKI